MSNTPLVDLTNICKYYSSGEAEVRALDGVDLTINQGEFLSILGPSGSGKSTLMNMLGCLDKPTDGQYQLGGQNVASLSPNELAGIRNQKIGFVFQSFNLFIFNAIYMKGNQITCQIKMPPSRSWKQSLKRRIWCIIYAGFIKNFFYKFRTSKHSFHLSQFHQYSYFAISKTLF